MRADGGARAPLPPLAVHGDDVPVVALQEAVRGHRQVVQHVQRRHVVVGAREPADLVTVRETQ